MHILHLSDLHFGSEKNARNWYSQVAEDLKYDLDCHHLDALIISGDIANKSAPDEYEVAERFLGNLCGEFGLGSDQIIIVPGNHDLSWTTAKSAYRPVRREDYKGPLDENCAICGDEFVQVLNEELYKQRFQDFSTFYQNIKSEPYPLEYNKQGILYHFREQNLLILGLNSAWQVDHHYRSRAGIHPDAISNALNRIRQNPEIYRNCFKFAVWHHPLASAGEDRITDLGFMQRLSQAGFCIAFHGHIHKSETGLYCYDHSADGRKINIVSAGTFGAPVREWVPGYPLQYNLFKLEDSELTVETRYRREPNGAWKPDAIWTQGPGKDPLPRYKIDLPGSPKTRGKGAKSEPLRITIKVFVEDTAGDRFECEISIDTKLSELAADFLDERNWPTTDNRGRGNRAVVELVDPENPDHTKRLRGEQTVGDVGLWDGSILRIFLE